MKKFEYTEMDIRWMSDITKKCNEMGQDGWEAYYVYAPSISLSSTVVAYFKREIEEQE
jgi:hypothetical protein